MLKVSRIVHNITKKCQNQKIFISCNKLQKSNRNFHHSVNLCVKMYMEHENRHAYRIMENKGYAVSLNTKKNKNSISKETFELLMKEDWSKSKPKQIFEAFSTLGGYCSEHGLCISNKIFDDYIDSLTDSMHLASDSELESIFHVLESWPETESIRTRNFIEVWAALDDTCLRRMKDWTFDQMLSFVTLFYMLNITKASEFCLKCLNRLATKAKQLTPGHLVQTMFFIGIIRKSPFDMHNLELRMIDLFDQLTLDEIAITSMGFFKSKTPIRSMELLSKIMNKIIEKPEEIHEVSLAALLKVLRYSIKINMDDQIHNILETLQPEIARLSVMCIVHLALLGTATLTLHKGCLTKIAERINNDLPTARLKDLERLVLTYATFDFIPVLKNNECFFQNVVEELRKPERHAEIEKYGRSLACCLSSLGLLGFYPVDLMNKVLDPEFLIKSYGKYCYLYGREVLAIHNSSLIFCAEAQMNRLTEKEAVLLGKKYTDYVPEETYKKQYNLAEKMFLDIMQVLKENRGGHDFVKGDHILTHHQRGDIIICNSQNGVPLPVTDVLKARRFGLIHRAPEDNNYWISLIIAGRNAIIHNTDMPSGHFQAKKRELHALGYHATLVPWSLYVNLKTKEEKSNYLNRLIKEAIKKP